MDAKDADIARVLSPLLADGRGDAAARLVAEPERVHCTELPDGARVWVVTGYDDVRQLLADPLLVLDQRVSRGGYRGFELPPALDANLLSMDGVDHARIRRLVVSAFTAQVDSLGERIQLRCDALIDAFPLGGSADLRDVYAGPLPVAVISDLLGVPDSDGAALRECTRVLLAPEKFGPAGKAAAVGRVVRVLSGSIAARRSEPADDLLSAMIATRDGEDLLSQDELLSLAFLILCAGCENSVHLITAATARLLAEPQRAARILAQSSPHTPQMREFVEEFLRDNQPVTNAIRRIATEDINVSGTVIPVGDIVYLAISAANRDSEAATLKAGHSSAGAHVSFGYGPHYCLGAPLARLETRIALWTLFHRLPDLALAVPAANLSWKTDHRQHALRSLPITYSPRPTQPT